MKIAYLHKEDWERDYVENKLQGHEVLFFDDLSSIPQETKSGIEVVSVFVGDQMNKETIDSFPVLKLIATRSTGFDHIDVAHAKSKNIEVVSVPSYGEHTVAEFAFALLLAISRKIYESYDKVSVSNSFEQKNLRGFDLEGKTIGVIGTGKIGINSIRIAKGFNMNVIASDPYPKNEEAEKMGFKYVELDTLFAESDIITLHAPYMESTHHMINIETLPKLKKGVFIINTARGGLIETDALIEGVNKGIIAGAGLDVLEEEGAIKEEMELVSNEHPNPEVLKTVLQNHCLADHPRVIVTPHNAFNTDEALKRIVDTTIDNIISFGNGEIKNEVKS